jgi:hypothetical protein
MKQTVHLWVIISEKPSIHDAYEPETPSNAKALWGYQSMPRRDFQLVSNRTREKRSILLWKKKKKATSLVSNTYPIPPFASPYTPDFLPKLVRISIPSIQVPDLT